MIITSHTHNPLGQGLELAKAAADADAVLDAHRQGTDGGVSPGHPFPSVDGAAYDDAWNRQAATSADFDRWMNHWRITLTADGLDRVSEARWPRS